MKHITVTRELLEDVLEELDSGLQAIGSCDHGVGICICSLYLTRDNVASALGRPRQYDIPEPEPVELDVDCGLCGAPVGMPHNQEAHYACVSADDFGPDELAA